jgi:hypothetical protein
MRSSIRAVLGPLLLAAACGGKASGGATGADADSLGAICTTCTGCQKDDSVTCSGGATGVSCPSPTYPTPNGGVFSNITPLSDGTEGLCFLAVPLPADTDCAVDYVIPGCDYPSYGLGCASGSPAPSTGDTGLVCDAPILAGNGSDEYCCTHP